MSHDFSGSLQCRCITGTYVKFDTACTGDITVELDFSSSSWKYVRKVRNIELKEGNSQKIIFIPKEIKDLSNLTIYCNDYQNIQSLDCQIIQ